MYCVLHTYFYIYIYIYPQQGEMLRMVPESSLLSTRMSKHIMQLLGIAPGRQEPCPIFSLSWVKILKPCGQEAVCSELLDLFSRQSRAGNPMCLVPLFVMQQCLQQPEGNLCLWSMPGGSAFDCCSFVKLHRDHQSSWRHSKWMSAARGTQRNVAKKGRLCFE